MAMIVLENLPDQLTAWLNQQANIHHRSVNHEVIALLEAVRASSDQKRLSVGVDELLEIGRRCAALPVLDCRSADEILGYNQNGLSD